jgi:pimeloyl-ACP methyl ester carboxylesterase
MTASEHYFKKEFVRTDLCTLTVFHNFTRPNTQLTVYIEGDGMAWRSRRELSEDPTPRHPLVLSLAIMDSSENSAYLARPGQLTLLAKPDCDPAYWSGKRFSAEVISAMNSVVDHLKSESRSREVNLIGYSGGAIIAVMMAAQRNDVVSLRTISGNLDPEAVNLYHGVAPMDGSPNLMDNSDKIAHIPQRHFAAENDCVIPFYITRSFAEKVGDKEGKSITVVKGTTHYSGWQKAWPSLLNLPLSKIDREKRQF